MQRAAAALAVVATELSRDHRSLKLYRSSQLPRQMHLRCRSKAAGRRLALCNMFQNSSLFRRD